MKKLAIVLLVTIASFCLAASAFAGSVAPGGMTKCNNAGSITIATAGGGDAEDRGNANGYIWKSSNFTTVQFTLGPNDHQGFSGNGGGAAGNSQVKMPSKHSMGHNSITFKGQNNFSRGDSIGDISGEVRIHNTGTVPVTVSCG
ncbi:MAG: hypothetical protein HOK41_02525 [Nitrospina sp.]|jgi:hypothetical protein|nr:hypothetical protein [Nitrospina sp.]MBT6718382.1 hypothetical protein [Nitrospina sp.]